MEGAKVPEEPTPVNAVTGNLRRISAYLLMLAFVICTSVGAYLITPAAGWIVAGVGCGIYGYLLGAD